MVDSNIVTDAMTKQFSDPDEPVLFASPAKKRSTYNINQSRVLIVTTHRIYMFEDSKMSRKHKIGHLAAIIKSSVGPEIVLIFPDLKNLHLEGVNDVQTMQSMI